jgi:SOS-response transcriptional repressor LexA
MTSGRERGIVCPGCGTHIRPPTGSLPSLTRRQRDLLDAIANFTLRNKVGPNYADSAAALGVASRSRICVLVNGLEERGYVARVTGMRRTLALTDAAWAVYQKDAGDA